MTRARVQSIESEGATGQVWIRDTSAAKGGAYGAMAGAGLLTAVKQADTLAGGVPTGTSYKDVPGMSITLEADTIYGFMGLIRLKALLAGTGIDIAINGPAASFKTGLIRSWRTPPDYNIQIFNAYDFNPVNTSSPSTIHANEINGMLATTAAGSLVPRYKAEGATGEIDVYAGSWLIAWKVV